MIDLLMKEQKESTSFWKNDMICYLQSSEWKEDLKERKEKQIQKIWLYSLIL